MDRPKTSMTLAGLMTIVAVVSALFALVVPNISRSRKLARKRDCVNNLRVLGTCLCVYVSKHGGDRYYPPAAGEGFFNTLRNVPTRGTAEASGSDGLFVCNLLGTKPSPTALDYREPAEQVSDGVTQPQWPIACDRPINHARDGDDDINVLYFSGSVSSASYGSPEWDEAMRRTRDPQ